LVLKVTAGGTSGLPEVPDDPVLHLSSTSFAPVPVPWTKATCEPSSETTGEVSTTSPLPVSYDHITEGTEPVAHEE